MIHILIGTRAQLIKMVPIMADLVRREVNYNFIFLAQHKETIYEIIDQFNLKRPDYVLCNNDRDIVETKEMIKWSIKIILQGFLKRKKIFQNDRKGIVLIHGDAPPLFLGALISKFQGLKVGAVEAGLRSYNYLKPFPEELIRVFTAKLKLIDVFFCQDLESEKNVKKYKRKSYVTNGNTIYDTLQLSKEILARNSPVNKEKPFAIVTIHRYETITNYERMKKIVQLLEEVSHKVDLKFILHPPTKTALIKYNLLKELKQIKKIKLMPRLDFLNFNKLMLKAQFIITDGGSNQEESAYLGIPCLLLRENTERLEGIGSNVIISKFDENIIDEFIQHYEKYRIITKIEGNNPTKIINDVITQYLVED